MEIKTKIEFVKGSFDTIKGELVCVQNKKYGDVELCFKSNMLIPFAKIELYSSNLAKDADATFEDAVKLGDEIVRRWNECENKK